MLPLPRMYHTQLLFQENYHTELSRCCEPANDPPHSLFESYDDMEFTIVFQSALFPTVFHQVQHCSFNQRHDCLPFISCCLSLCLYFPHTMIGFNLFLLDLPMTTLSPPFLHFSCHRVLAVPIQYPEIPFTSYRVYLPLSFFLKCCVQSYP